MRRPRSTIADHPDQLALWDPERNLPARSSTVGHRSSKRYWWRCPVADDHRWQAPPASVARSLSVGFTGCPACAGRQVSVTNSLAARHPDIAAQWHPARNGDLTPDQVPAGTGQYAWWQCPHGPDHEWRAVISSRTKAGVGCPACAGKQVSVTNSIASHPVLSEEWHPTKNLPLTPDAVVAGTGKKLWWRCADEPDHVWAASGANRSKGRGCPFCVTHLRSTLEICLAYELADFLPDVDLDDDKVVVAGSIRHVDLLVRGLQLVIEVDGYYHHDGTEDADRRKTAQLEADGWHVIRLREHPLVPLGPGDVQMPDNATTKQATDLVLTVLRDRGFIDGAAVAGYLRQTEPRHLSAAMAEVRRRRPGKPVRIPGTPPGPDRMTRWETHYAALLDHVDREGHAAVAFEHREGEVALGNWVSVQRSRYRRGTLADDRVARLDAVPGWVWDPVADAWEDGFAHLLAFLSREGHVRVQAHHVEADGYPLGSWVRSHRRRGGRRTMTEHQRRRLEAIPGWSYESATDQHWERAFALLATFAAEHDHLQAPQSTEIDLSGWMARQRHLYRKGALEPERAGRLEQLPGWSWTPSTDAWERGFAMLQAFVAREGHALVARDHREGGYPLGSWVREQRSSRDTLPADRHERLDAVPGWSWAPHEDRWERTFALLEQFVTREGHAGVPTGHLEDDVELGSWVIRHRIEHKQGRVPENRARRLEALPGWMWDTRAASWERHYRALRDFADRTGHARVPYGHQQDGLRLGAWVVSQRAARRRADLSDERAARLELVVGWTWDGRRRETPGQHPTLF